MITSGTFLFLALQLACLTAETAVENIPDGCTRISEKSFLTANCESSLMTTLGEFCSRMFPGRGTDGQWLGTMNNGDPKCRVCCVFSNKNNQYYNVTTAPNGLPCGPNKTCRSGMCQFKKK
uniref:Putative ixostatin n=1 Tax=Ixodes ricinus TaxID=34613 RepID=A0A0K8RJ04_IXORI